MRQRVFKYTRGDIVQICPGLEFASPLSRTQNRREPVKILKAYSERFYGGVYNYYYVRSLVPPFRVYVLQESFIQLVKN